MGLLDRGWGNWSDDEVKNDSINRGLLATGLSLLNSRGTFGQALGAAGQDGLQEQQRAFVLGQNDKLKTTERLIREQELKQLVSIAAQRQKLHELAQKSVIPATTAQQGNNPSAFTPGTPGGFDYNGYAAGLPELGIVPEPPAPPKTITLPDGTVLEVGGGAVKELYKPAPKAEKIDPNKPFLGIGPDGQPIPNTAYQEYERKRLAASQSAGQGPSAYYTPVQTKDGVYAFNARTGTVTPVTQDGKQIVGVTADPKLAGAMTTAREEAEAGVKSGVDRKAAVKKADQFLSVAKQAEELLKKEPTSSVVGAGLDAAGRVFGYASESADTAGELEAVSGWLVANVPRMEGPQSNFDVDNYKTMAGKVGDRKVPLSERKKALAGVMRLQNEYKHLNQDSPGPAAAPARTVKRTGIANGRKVVEYSDGSVEYAD